MQGRFPFFIYRRLRFSTSQLSSVRKISSSSEEAFSENLSALRRESLRQPSCKQHPSQDFASGFNLNLPRDPDPNSNLNPISYSHSNPTAEKFESKLDLHLNPNPTAEKFVNGTNSSSSASLPEGERCIWAVERLSKGKKFTRLDKAQNRVPGFVCEQDEPNSEHVLIVMDKFQIQNVLNLLGEERFLCTIFTLEVFDGFGSNKVLYRERVLPRRINFNKLGEVSNVGYTKATPGMKLRLDVPIRINGQEDCPGLRKGGLLKVYLSYVSLFCLPEELPQFVGIDVNDMDIGDRICVGDLRNRLPLHLDNKTFLPICEIIGEHT